MEVKKIGKERKVKERKNWRRRMGTGKERKEKLKRKNVKERKK